MFLHHLQKNRISSIVMMSRKWHPQIDSASMINFGTVANARFSFNFMLVFSVNLIWAINSRLLSWPPLFFCFPLFVFSCLNSLNIFITRVYLHKQFSVSRKLGTQIICMKGFIIGHFIATILITSKQLIKAVSDYNENTT